MSALDISVSPNPTPTSDDRVAEILADPGFGVSFTDHMVTVEWTPEEGWHDARVTAYGPISLDPATAVLHYAQEIFEGMKAYRHADGSIWSFRPEANGERLRRSARRLALPELPVEDFLATVTALVEADQRWVPDAAGEKSLYLRPFMFASEAFLGVRPAKHVTYMVIASPGRRLLRPRREAGLDHGQRALHARRRRRPRRREDRRQLRQLAGPAERGHRARLRPGRLPRRRSSGGTSRSSAA